MNAVFLRVIELSIAAACIVAVILVLRLLLRNKAPKWIMCCLWLLVAVRLVFPFTIESVLSMQPDVDNIASNVTATVPPQEQHGNNATVIQPGSNTTVIQPGSNTTVIQPGSNTTVINPGDSNLTVNPGGNEIVEHSVDWVSILAIVWLVGVGVMAAYAVISVIILKIRLLASTPLEKGIRQNDYVRSPFVMGVFRPTIYLPYSLSPENREFVVAHERAHIRRGDHLWKPLGFVLLSIHWFNPLIWVAYALLCRDIESACDEKVIRKYTKEERQAYSRALLTYSSKQRNIAACPVAFGEVGVKNRIKGIMNYKKPSFWIIIVALLAGFGIAVAFLTSPPEKTEDVPTPTPTASPTATPTSEPTPTPDSLNYDVPPVKMDVVCVKEDCAHVLFWLDGKFDGARAFINGPIRVEKLVNGYWDTVDPSLVEAYDWILQDTDFSSATVRVKLTPPAYWEKGQSYRISMPLVTDRDSSKGKEYEASVEFVYEKAMLDTMTAPSSLLEPTDLANLPDYYSREEAMVDGGFSICDGNVIDYLAMTNFRKLLYCIENGISGTMRFSVCTFGTDTRPTKIDYHDIVFDGTKYTIRTLVDRENGVVESHDYKYLLRLDGPKETPDAKYDYFERYVLTNAENVTWEDIQAGRYTDYFVLYSTLFNYRKAPEIRPDIAKITLQNKGEQLGEITSPNTCAMIYEFVSKSTEYHMEDYCSCGWYNVDKELQLILWYDDGSQVVINPVRDQGIIAIGETHYKVNGPYLETIRACFGLKNWPK